MLAHEAPVGWAEAEPNPNIAMCISTLGFGFASAQPTVVLGWLDFFCDFGDSRDIAGLGGESFDALDVFAECAMGFFEIVIGLQAEPKAFAGT